MPPPICSPCPQPSRLLGVENRRNFRISLLAICLTLACQTVPQTFSRQVRVPAPPASATESPANDFTQNRSTPERVETKSQTPLPATKRPSSEAYVSVLQGELHAAQAEYPAAIERYREALLYDRDSDTLTLRLGELYALSGDYERALDHAQRVIKRTPDSLAGARLYAESLGLVGENEEAISFLRNAISRHPSDRALSELLASQHIARGEVREAEDVIEKWMSLETNSIDGYVSLARLFVDEGELENALRYLERALARNAHAAEALELQRDLLYAQGDYPVALQTMQRLAAEHGDSLRTRQDLLLAKLLAEHADEAKTLTDTWLKTDNSLQMRLGLAWSYERAGLPDASLDLLLAAEGQGSARLRNALDIEVTRLAFQTRKFRLVEDRGCRSPDEKEKAWQKDFMRALCVRAMHKNGKSRAAAAYLRHALDDAPASWRLLSTWNDFFTEKEFGFDLDESEKRMKRALQESPRDPDVVEAVAAWYEKSDRPKEAKSLLERYAGQAVDKNEGWMALARHFERQDKPFAAIELAEEAMTLQVSTQTLNFLAFTMADHGIRVGEALDYAQRAVARAPLEGYILDTLGWTHFRLGHDEKALHFLQMANRLSPGEPEILFHLAQALVRTGNRKEAQKHLEDAAKWVHNPKLAEQIQGLLAELRNPK